MTMADVLSFNDNDAGAEEDEVAVNIDCSKRDDFATGLLSICQDYAAMMMYAPSPLPAHRPPPHYREQWAQRMQDQLAPIKMVSRRAWSPGIYRALRLLGKSLDVAWERAFIHPLTFY